MRFRSPSFVLATVAFFSAPATALEPASPGIELVQGMVEAYQSADSYHARWTVVVEEEAGPATRSELEVAFDRATGAVLVRRQALAPGEDASSSRPAGEVLVGHGRRMEVARRDDGAGPVSVLRFDPDAATYWVVERALSFAPIELPLLYGVPPVAGWLHAQGAAIEASPADAGDPSAGHELRIVAGDERAAIKARLDASHFIRRASSERARCTYTLESMSVNERLDGSVFDFERQSAFLDGRSPADPAVAR